MESVSSGNSYLSSIFVACVVVLNGCYDDFVVILQKHIKKQGCVRW